jgi:hypothetical protein
VTGDDSYAEAAVERMLAQPLSTSNEPQYSLIWSHALAYDWLFHHAALTEEKRDRILSSILERLETELAELDRTGMALWHGRNQAANGTLIAALAVGDLTGQEQNLRRAAALHRVVAGVQCSRLAQARLLDLQPRGICCRGGRWCDALGSDHDGLHAKSCENRNGRSANSRRTRCLSPRATPPARCS